MFIWRKQIIKKIIMWLDLVLSAIFNFDTNVKLYECTINYHPATKITWFACSLLKTHGKPYKQSVALIEL